MLEGIYVVVDVVKKKKKKRKMNTVETFISMCGLFYRFIFTVTIGWRGYPYPFSNPTYVSYPSPTSISLYFHVDG